MIFSKLLVAYDGSNLSKKALDKAIQIAKDQSAHLEIVHAYQFPSFAIGEALITASPSVELDTYNYAQASLEEAVQRAQGVPHLHAALLQGRPAECILQHAESVGCDLIIIGSRGLSGIREFMLGSVSHNVVQHARVPVLVIKS